MVFAGVLLVPVLEPVLEPVPLYISVSTHRPPPEKNTIEPKNQLSTENAPNEPSE